MNNNKMQIEFHEKVMKKFRLNSINQFISQFFFPTQQVMVNWQICLARTNCVVFICKCGAIRASHALHLQDLIILQ